MPVSRHHSKIVTVSHLPLITLLTIVTERYFGSIILLQLCLGGRNGMRRICDIIVNGG